jgi:glycosyltransferase involved in cell wall biosynthesis
MSSCLKTSPEKGSGSARRTSSQAAQPGQAQASVVIPCVNEAPSIALCIDKPLAEKIFVVIPAYQAALTIEDVFQRLGHELRAKDITYVVVEDGCTDGTVNVVRRIQAGRRDVRLIEHGKNRGYAQAQKTGFTAALEAGADIIVLLHADGQYAPEMLPTLLAPLERDEADLVQGSRMVNRRDALKGGMPLARWLGNVFLSTLENWVYGLKMAEYHSGYMLYKRRVLTSIPFHQLSNTFHFDGEMLFMAAKRGMRIKEIAIPTRYADEKSHLNPITYGFNVLRIMWKYVRGHYDF